MYFDYCNSLPHVLYYNHGKGIHNTRPYGGLLMFDWNEIGTYEYEEAMADLAPVEWPDDLWED